jgi:hypothetical protein
MFDLTTETPLPLNEAVKFIPPARNGKATHFGTVLRWILSGCKDPDGRTVRLEALRLGGRWMTSREAIQRFAEALTPQLESAPTLVKPRPATKRQRESERAAAALNGMGV